MDFLRFEVAKWSCAYIWLIFDSYFLETEEAKLPFDSSSEN